VLDPTTGTCDLYESRPLTCRTFGPAIRSGGAVGVCELCFPGANEDEIAACAVELDVDAVEMPFLQQFTGEEVPRPTLVALALAL
jgi:Fe-S-cluster containining protein